VSLKPTGSRAGPGHRPLVGRGWPVAL